MKSVAVIGAALDLGAGRRGVDMGPSAIRYAGLAERLASLGLEVIDCGNVPADIAEATDEGDEQRALPPADQGDVRAHRRASSARDARTGSFPLVLGGDHSVALGSLGGLAAAHGPGGVLWIDAHGDLNRPETSPSGNVHGMVLAAALGLAGAGVRERGVADARGRPDASRARRHPAARRRASGSSSGSTACASGR